MTVLLCTEQTHNNQHENCVDTNICGGHTCDQYTGSHETSRPEILTLAVGRLEITT